MIQAAPVARRSPLFHAAAPLVILGAGNMAHALCEGWDQQADALFEAAEPSVILLARSSGSAARFARFGWLRCVASTSAMEPMHPALWMLAVKPQQMADLFASLPAWFHADLAPVCSLAAGIGLPAYSAWLAPSRPLIRLMPNLPVACGAGVISAMSTASVLPADHALVTALMASVGACFWFDDAARFDVATALGGCGPAYLYAFTEALTAAGIAHGLSPDTAAAMALHTLSGAAKQQAQSALSPAALREAVTSKGGVTEAALAVLCQPQQGLAPLLEQTLSAALARSDALAQSAAS